MIHVSFLLRTLFGPNAAGWRADISCAQASWATVEITASLDSVFAHQSRGATSLERFRVAPSISELRSWPELRQGVHFVAFSASRF